MSEVYRVEISVEGCPTCQHDALWDIIGPNETAQSQTWGDKEEADYICDLLNIAHQQGRVSYAEEVVERLQGEINDKKQTEPEAVEAPPTPAEATTEDDIPW